MDAVALVNLFLSVVIVVLGVWEYTRTKSRVALYVGVAFGLFGISHLLTLLGLADSLMGLLIIIRYLAYMTVIYVLYINIRKKKEKV
jgi:uncharacterized membrane protein (UPF0136 family)